MLANVDIQRYINNYFPYYAVPRINIELPDALHRKCKLAAVSKAKSLKAFITEELEQAL